ncbi:MAG: hypothetical protein KF774_02035 [Planctomyces sp.]|nr:hypothetical protein [Planctomyces sp.]
MSQTIEMPGGWQLQFEASPEWAFFRLVKAYPGDSGEPPLAETIVRTAYEHGLRRIVLEVDDQVMLYSYLVGQLVALHKRLLIDQGTFRLSGLSGTNADVLKTLRLTDRLPNYRDREAAVMGRL